MPLREGRDEDRHLDRLPLWDWPLRVVFFLAALTERPDPPFNGLAMPVAGGLGALVGYGVGLIHASTHGKAWRPWLRVTRTRPVPTPRCCRRGARRAGSPIPSRGTAALSVVSRCRKEYRSRPHRLRCPLTRKHHLLRARRDAAGGRPLTLVRRHGDRAAPRTWLPRSHTHHTEVTDRARGRCHRGDEAAGMP